MTLRARAFSLTGLAVALVALVGLAGWRGDRRMFGFLRADAAVAELHERSVAIRRQALAQGRAASAESLRVELRRADTPLAVLRLDRDTVGSLGLPEDLRRRAVGPLLAAWDRFAEAAEGLAAGAARDTASFGQRYRVVLGQTGALAGDLDDAMRDRGAAITRLMGALSIGLLAAFGLLLAVLWVGIVRPSDRTLQAIERRSAREASGEPLELADAAPELARLIAAFNRILGSLARSRDELRRTLNAADTLYAALRASRGVLDLASLAEIMAELARDTGGAEYAVVTLRDPPGDRISLFAVAGFPRHLAPPGALPQGQGLLAPLRQGETIRSDNVAQDPRRAGVPPWHPPIGALLGVPVEALGRGRGEIYIANRRSGGPFSGDEEACLRALARFVGYAVEQAETHEVMTADAKVRATVDLAAGMAHEINNAVQGMRLSLEEIGAVAREAPPGSAEEITQRSAECVTLLDRVTSVTRRVGEAVGARRAGVCERVNLAALARDAAARAQTQVPATAPIRVVAPEEVWLDGHDRTQLAFVLDSLSRWFAQRAAASRPTGGGIHVRVAEVAGQAVLVEIGHATMPPPADPSSIFEPAVRPASAAGGRMELDLDLVLVRSVVQAAGARITAAAGADGTGLTFCMEFRGAASRA